MSVDVENRLRERKLWSIVERIAKERGVRPTEIIGRTRTKRVVGARHELCAMLYSAGYSYPEIGALLDRDHTTIMASVRARKLEIARGDSSVRMRIVRRSA